MTYRWIVFGLGLAAVGGGAWYFSRPVLPRVAPAAVKVAEAAPAPAAAPKELPPPVIEVIDLARAYEPVREGDAPADVRVAGWVTDPSAPPSIPPAAFEGDLDEIEVKVVCECGSYWERLTDRLPREQIGVAPRVVGMVDPGPQPVPPARIGPAAVHDEQPPPERLKVMPREVAPVQIQREERERQTGVREDDFVGLPIGP